MVRVFKNGYEPLTVFKTNNVPGNPHVHGQTLRLRRFEGAASDYAEQMNTLWMPLNVNFVAARCEWQATPRLFQALVQLKHEFDAAGVRSSLPLESSLCPHVEPHQFKIYIEYANEVVTDESRHYAHSRATRAPLAGAVRQTGRTLRVERRRVAYPDRGPPARSCRPCRASDGVAVGIANPDDRGINSDDSLSCARRRPP